MLDLGDAGWTVIAERATLLLLQTLLRGTYVPRGSWPKMSSATGYHEHETAPYVPAWDIPNNWTPTKEKISPLQAWDCLCGVVVIPGITNECCQI